MRVFLTTQMYGVLASGGALQELTVAMLSTLSLIALNFWGSKFSQIKIFEDFIEIILWIRCIRTSHMKYTYGHGSLSNTHRHSAISSSSQ